MNPPQINSHQKNNTYNYNSFINTQSPNKVNTNIANNIMSPFASSKHHAGLSYDLGWKMKPVTNKDLETIALIQKTSDFSENYVYETPRNPKRFEGTNQKVFSI